MRFNDTSSITYMLFVILEKSKTQDRLSVFFFHRFSDFILASILGSIIEHPCHIFTKVSNGQISI